MKIISVSDLHLTAQTPIGRKDDYAEASLHKLRQVIDYTNARGDVLVLPGDIFDRATVPTWYTNRVINEFSRLRRPCIAIPGNHDLPQHNLNIVKDSSLWTLHIAEALKVYPLGSFEHPPEAEGERWVTFHTCPFGSDPADLEPIPEHYNVLVAHIPAFDKAVPFYMLDALTIDQLEARYSGYDLYLVGDIHERAARSKTIVTGSMLRRTILQKEFKPGFWVIDTETDSRTMVEFKIAEDVWHDTAEFLEEDSYRAELANLAETLRQRAEKPDYRATVTDLAAKVPEMGAEINTKIQGYIDEYHQTAA